MKIIQSIMTKNPCYKLGKKIKVKGLMLHSVGCPQPKAKAFIDNWNNEDYDRACVHGFIDGNSGDIYQTLPWDHRGWHAGGSANDTHIGVEMCEPACIKYTSGSSFTCSDVATAKAVVKRTYNAAVELFAFLCKEFDLDPLADGVIVSHKEGHKRGISSNHGDPEHLWTGLGMGYTMNGFRQDVKEAMEAEKAETKTEEKKEESVLYRVQVGAFSKRENSENMLAKIKKAGFEAIIVKIGNYYKVQCGAFALKKNAENQLAKLEKAGFDGFITTQSGSAVITSEYYQKYTGSSYGIDTVFQAIGVPSIYRGSPKNRKPVAEANGVKSYTGTAEQNTKLVSLAKQGKLKKV